MKTTYKRLNRNHRIETEKLITLSKNNSQIADASFVGHINFKKFMGDFKNQYKEHYLKIFTKIF